MGSLKQDIEDTLTVNKLEEFGKWKIHGMTTDVERTFRILHWGLVLVGLANITLFSILIYLRVFQRKKTEHLSTDMDHRSVDSTENEQCDEESEQSIMSKSEKGRPCDQDSKVRM